jgi:hypothetical protein
MVRWFVLAQECRLSMKATADYVLHGQQVSLPARQDTLSSVLGGFGAGDLGFRCHGSRPSSRDKTKSGELATVGQEKRSPG